MITKYAERKKKKKNPVYQSRSGKIARSSVQLVFDKEDEKNVMQCPKRWPLTNASYESH